MNSYVPISSFIAGLTDSYNPCSLGVLFVSLSLLIALQRTKSIWLFGVSYLSTIFVTYFLIGLGMLRAFHLFGIHNFFGWLAGVVLILVGLIHFFPSLWPSNPITRFLRSCHVPASLNQHLDKGIFIAGVILGFLIGLCNLPCAGGVYLGVISLLALHLTYWQGVANLFVFNLGFILPLVIIFIVASRPAVLDRLKHWNVQIAQYGTMITSLLMIGLGIGMLVLLALD